MARWNMRYGTNFISEYTSFLVSLGAGRCVFDIPVFRQIKSKYRW